MSTLEEICKKQGLWKWGNEKSGAGEAAKSVPGDIFARLNKLEAELATTSANAGIAARSCAPNVVYADSLTGPALEAGVTISFIRTTRNAGSEADTSKHEAVGFIG